MNSPYAHERRSVARDADRRTHWRDALIRTRDQAAQMMGNTLSHRAYGHAYDAHQVAGEFIFADLPEQRLEAAARYCHAQVKSAMLAEQIDLDGDW